MRIALIQQKTGWLGSKPCHAAITLHAIGRIAFVNAFQAEFTSVFAAGYSWQWGEISFIQRRSKILAPRAWRSLERAGWPPGFNSCSQHKAGVDGNWLGRAERADCMSGGQLADRPIRWRRAFVAASWPPLPTPFSDLWLLSDVPYNVIATPFSLVVIRQLWSAKQSDTAHEFHETCHSAIFYVMKKRLQTLLWHLNVRVNSDQRWKQMRFRICFHLWCELTSTMSAIAFTKKSFYQI